MNIIVDGYNIEYSILGEGEKTAIILQGWGTTKEVYNVIVKALEDRFRVLVFNLPGFGGSTEPREPWAVDDYVDFFLKFVKELGITSATLIGHSYGGRMIIKLSSRHQTDLNIEKIILVDAAGVVNPKSLKTKVKIGKYKIAKKFMNSWFMRFFFEIPVEEWKKKQGSDDYRNSSEVMKACLVKAVNENLVSLFPEVREDVLLVWGENDTATPLSDGRKMEKEMKNATLRVIPGAGHFSFVDNPKLFTEIIREFV